VHIVITLPDAAVEKVDGTLTKYRHWTDGQKRNIALPVTCSINQSIHGISKAPLTKLDSGAGQKYSNKIR